MQQTSFDYFLKERFVYIYHISVNRIPRRTPKGVSVSPAPRNDSQRWGFIITCDNLHAYKATVAYIRAKRMLYAANIKERNTIMSRIFNPRGQGSFTYNTLWTSIRMATGVAVIDLGMAILPGVGLKQICDAMVTRG